MGEEAQELPTPSLGVASIDVRKVTLPTEEAIIGLDIELTSSDRKWSQFQIRTTQRRVSIGPGSVGQVPFRAYCDLWAKMLATPQGAAMLAASQAFVTGKPLELRSTVAEVAVVLG